ncbi:MAG TPA: cysteine--tRNA ligase [Candidatus Limnocylindrales bacterium]|jgi:cysteinyl-tRNA synthetase|nr:cysteine--tRNA ligase [Candidatus Limnocylindrales bacterium]
MPLHLYNTLTNKVEEFRPAEDNTVRMYACGPTVYDFGHIGNFRTFVAVDLLRRFLKQSGYKLQHVMNITDVDDKIIRNAAREGKSVQEYTKKYEHAFLEDMETLNLQRPEKMVRATEHIAEMADFIKKLEEKGYAYRTEDGSYYFRIAKFPEYGKLSKKDFGGIEVGARVDVDEYDKDNARDFALWKAPKPGEQVWETAIGPGRPGWHIECSVMSMKYLGDSFDLHGGGEDLTFPHHENEIAQSESLTGKIFARFWMHVRFLLVEGKKMSKSEGNFYTLRDLVLKGHKPSAIRFLLTSVPYRKQLNFTMDGLTQGQKSVERLREFKTRVTMAKVEAGKNDSIQQLAADTKRRMREAMEDDLNTAEAMGAMFEMVREVNTLADRGELREEDKAPLLSALDQFDEIFDVLKDDDAAKIARIAKWGESEGKAEAAALSRNGIPDEEVDRLVADRTAAKKARDFARADAIRAQLSEAGIIVEDTKDGIRWKRK